MGHAHCYTCGARLTGRAEKGARVRLPSVRALRAWPGWAKLGAVSGVFSRRASVKGYDGRPVALRTWGDRVARWYVTLSVVGVAMWLLAGPSVGLPASASGAIGAVGTSEACAWVDGQRVQLMGEAGRLLEAPRGEVARRLGELSAAVAATR